MMLVTTRRFAPARRRSAFTLIEVLVVVAILVILATIAAVAVPKQLDEAKKSKAQLGCVTIARAIDSYHMSTSNPNQGNPDGLPNDPSDLVNPGNAFGSPTASFLPDGQKSLNDPWNQPYQFRRATKDGNDFILVLTTAPDGTQITQFGVGGNSRANEF